MTFFKSGDVKRRRRRRRRRRHRRHQRRNPQQNKFHSSKKPELNVQKEKVSTEWESRTRSYKKIKLFLSHKTAIIDINLYHGSQLPIVRDFSSYIIRCAWLIE